MLDAHSAAGDVDRASKGKINETGLSGDSSSVVSDSDQRDCVYLPDAVCEHKPSIGNSSVFFW